MNLVTLTNVGLNKCLIKHNLGTLVPGLMTSNWFHISDYPETRPRSFVISHPKIVLIFFTENIVGLFLSCFKLLRLTLFYYNEFSFFFIKVSDKKQSVESSNLFLV